MSLSVCSVWFKYCLEPSIGNHSEEFFNNWHEKLQTFALTRMSDVSTFCKSKIEALSL